MSTRNRVKDIPKLDPPTPKKLAAPVAEGESHVAKEVRPVDVVRAMLNEQGLAKFSAKAWKTAKKDHFFMGLSIEFLDKELKARGFSPDHQADVPDVDAISAKYLELMDPQPEGSADQVCVNPGCTSSKEYKFQPYSWAIEKDGEFLKVNAPNTPYDGFPKRTGQVVLTIDGTAIAGYVCRRCRDGYFDDKRNTWVKGLRQRGVDIFDLAGAERAVARNTRGVTNAQARADRFEEGAKQFRQRPKGTPKTYRDSGWGNKMRTE